MLLTSTFLILLASILVIFLTDATNISLLRSISLSSSGLVLILSSILITQFDNSVYHFQNISTYSIGSDVLNFVYSFGLDGISLFFFFLSSLLIFLCILFIWNDHLFKEYVLNLLLIELFLLIIFILPNFYI
jgi:NADH-quinone oxidoreductase subunit M